MVILMLALPVAVLVFVLLMLRRNNAVHAARGAAINEAHRRALKDIDDGRYERAGRSHYAALDETSYDEMMRTIYEWPPDGQLHQVHNPAPGARAIRYLAELGRRAEERKVSA